MPAMMIYRLQMLPMPDDDFGPDEARRWLEEDLPSYTSIIQDGAICEPMEAGENTRGWPWFVLADDLSVMSRACGAVLAGEDVDFERGDKDGPDVLVPLLVAHQLDDHDRCNFSFGVLPKLLRSSAERIQELRDEIACLKGQVLGLDASE